MLGYAIDTNVRHVRTVVFDQARHPGEPDAAERFTTRRTSASSREVFTDAELSRGIVSGQARVGIKIPEDYSRRLQAGQTAQVLILVDGSESSVAAEAVNVGNAIALRESLTAAPGRRPLPVEPGRGPLQSRHALGQFLHPGPDGRALPDDGDHAGGQRDRPREGERDAGAAVHDAGAARELMRRQDAALSGADLGRVLHDRPADERRSSGCRSTALPHAAGVVLPFVLTMLGLGLLISTRRQTRDAAMQMSMATVHPVDLPLGLRLPARLDAAALPVLSQTGPDDLADRRGPRRDPPRRRLGRALAHAVVLWGMAIVSLTVSAVLFRKRLG